MRDEIKKLIAEFDEGNMPLDELETKLLILYPVSKRYDISYMLRSSRDIKKIEIQALSEDEAIGKLICDHPKAHWLSIDDA